MNGSLYERGKGKWSYIYNIPDSRYIDSKGRLKYKQKTVTIEAKTKREAEKKAAEITHQRACGNYIEPSKITTGEWLDRWMAVYIKQSSRKKLRTIETYEGVVRCHLKPKLGAIPLQKLRSSDIQQYYNNSELSQSTLEQHQAILFQALKVAVINEKIIPSNPAEFVPEKPKAGPAKEHIIWTPEETQAFLKAARQKSIHSAALWTTIMELGLRKGEALGLQWSDINFTTRQIHIQRTLSKPGVNFVLNPPKSGRSRVICMSEHLAKLLQQHQKAQDGYKNELDGGYSDFGFVFAKDTGYPLQANNIGQREFAELIETADIRHCRIHDLRHWSATHLINSGQPIKVAQQRLGHAEIGTTMDIYAHLLPDVEKAAADLMGNLLSEPKKGTKQKNHPKMI